MYNGIKINHIVAINKFGYIGYKNKLIWNCPEDLQRFKNITKNSIVIMGKNTWISLPKKPLPNRYNFVITSDNSIPNSYNNLDECLKHATEIAKSKDISEIWIIGGSQLYKSTINMIDDVHLSIINNRSLGDTKYLNELTRKNILNLTDFFENNYNLQLIEKSGNLENLGYEFLLFSRK